MEGCLGDGGDESVYTTSIAFRHLPLKKAGCPKPVLRVWRVLCVS